MIKQNHVICLILLVIVLLIAYVLYTKYGSASVKEDFLEKNTNLFSPITSVKYIEISGRHTFHNDYRKDYGFGYKNLEVFSNNALLEGTSIKYYRNGQRVNFPSIRGSTSFIRFLNGQQTVYFNIQIELRESINITELTDLKIAPARSDRSRASETRHFSSYLGVVLKDANKNIIPDKLFSQRYISVLSGRSNTASINTITRFLDNVKDIDPILQLKLGTIEDEEDKIEIESQGTVVPIVPEESDNYATDLIEDKLIRYLEFNTNKYVELTSSSLNQTLVNTLNGREFTICFWAKITGDNEGTCKFLEIANNNSTNKNLHLQRYTTSNGKKKIGFRFYANDVDTVDLDPTLIGPGEWHHYIFSNGTAPSGLMFGDDMDGKEEPVQSILITNPQVKSQLQLNRAGPTTSNFTYIFYFEDPEHLKWVIMDLIKTEEPVWKKAGNIMFGTGDMRTRIDWMKLSHNQKIQFFNGNRGTTQDGYKNFIDVDRDNDSINETEYNIKNIYSRSIYIDGKFQSTEKYDPNNSNNSLTLNLTKDDSLKGYLGRNYSGNGGKFTGGMCDLRIYNTKIDRNQAREFYNQIKDGLPVPTTTSTTTTTTTTTAPPTTTSTTTTTTPPTTTSTTTTTTPPTTTSTTTAPPTTTSTTTTTGPPTTTSTTKPLITDIVSNNTLFSHSHLPGENNHNHEYDSHLGTNLTHSAYSPVDDNTGYQPAIRVTPSSTLENVVDNRIERIESTDQKLEGIGAKLNKIRKYFSLSSEITEDFTNFHQNYQVNLEDLVKKQLNERDAKFDFVNKNNNIKLERIKNELKSLENLRSDLNLNGNESPKSIMALHDDTRINFYNIKSEDGKKTDRVILSVNDKLLAYGEQHDDKGTPIISLEDIEKYENPAVQFKISTINNAEEYNLKINHINNGRKSLIPIDNNISFPFQLVSPIFHFGFCLTVKDSQLSIVQCANNRYQRFKYLKSSVLEHCS